MKRLGNARLWLPALGAGLIAAGLYAATLMVVVSNCASEYCVDVGEFQVALATWGTVHHTGYPLFMLLGSPFVALLARLGVSPAAAASVYSLVWEAAAIAGTALIIAGLTRTPSLAVAGAVLVAVFEPVWVHGSLAEVYSFSLVITVGLFGLAFWLRRRWSDEVGWLLALVAGVGVAHHRLMALVLPAIGLFLLGPAWRSRHFWRWLAVALVCFLAGFLPYLDVPARVWRGSTWNYGQPQTWDGFWFIFWGTETGSLRAPAANGPELVQAVLTAGQTLVRLMTWPGLLGCLVAGALAWRQPALRPTATVLTGALACCLAFSIVFHRAVLLEATLMPALLISVLLATVGLSTLPNLGRLAGTVGLVILTVAVAYQTAPLVKGLTSDQSGVALAHSLEQVAAPAEAVVMVPWGQGYFDLAYAQRVEKRFANWSIVDHRADLRTLAQASGTVYTLAATPYTFGMDWWADRLGGPLRVSSAGPDWIEITRQPLPAPDTATTPLGDGIALADCAVTAEKDGRRIVVTAWWVATQPVATNYSSYAYGSARPTIQAPEDLLAQSDFATPVYGWFPTSQWPVGEVVREDHVLEVPAEASVQAIFVGMYAQTASGAFEQLGQLRLSGAGQACTAERVSAGP